MRSGIIWLALAACCLADVPQVRLRALTEELCAPGLEGRMRGSEGGRQAAAVLARAFADAELQPWQDSFEHTFPAGELEGVNVVGWLPGQSERLLVVGGHYDGSGYVGGYLTPGADHNASAMAGMIEIARQLVGRDEPRELGIVFAAFDFGLGAREGSQHLLAQLGPENVVAMLNLEMLAGDPVPGLADSFFALGAESSLALGEALAHASTPLQALDGGIYLVESQGPRGDYEAFRKARIPFLYVSSGVTRHFDKPSDTPETLNYEKLQGICDFLVQIVQSLSTATPSGYVESEVPPTHEEVLGVARMVRQVLDARTELGLSDATIKALNKRAEKLEALTEYEEIPLRKRAYLQKTLELVLIIITQAD